LYKNIPARTGSDPFNGVFTQAKIINWPGARPFEGAGIVAGDVHKAKNAILDFDAFTLETN